MPHNIFPKLSERPQHPTVFKFDDSEDHYLSRLSSLMIDPESIEPDPETLLSLNDTPILWRGSKSFVCAVAKARKTTTLTMFAAILCGRDETANGFMAAEGCRVLYVDTEQSRHDSQKILFRVAELCGKSVSEISEHLTVLSLNSESANNIKALMETAIRAKRPDVVILDNWSDCVNSIMDDTECTEFSRQLRVLAETYQIALFSVIHANESARSDTKPNFRGWGAEEARKSDLTMFLIDKGDYSEASFGRCRGRRPEGFNIGIDDSGLPYINSADVSSKTPTEKYEKIIAEMPKTGITHTDLCRIIQRCAGIASASSKRWVATMANNQLIVLANGLYYRCADAPPKNTLFPVRSIHCYQT